MSTPMNMPGMHHTLQLYAETQSNWALGGIASLANAVAIH